MSGNLLDNEGYLCYNVSENAAKADNPDNDEDMGSVYPYKDDFDVPNLSDSVNTL